MNFTNWMYEEYQNTLNQSNKLREDFNPLGFPLCFLCNFYSITMINNAYKQICNQTDLVGIRHKLPSVLRDKKEEDNVLFL